MTNLSAQQIKYYNEKGYIAPIDVLSNQEVSEIRKEIETIEKKWPDALAGPGRNYVHLISPVFNKLCLNKKILDAVESIIGKNILICGTTLFIKNPNEKGFVSFHQDAKYIGLEPHNWVTAWIAITDANEENGCMQMWPRSHKKNLIHHTEKFDENNLLTRGQAIENVPSEEIESVVLETGQMSLHHPTVIHGSGLNKSNDRRIGFVVQSYIGTNVNQVLGKMYVQKARGEDTYKFHKYSDIPQALMTEEDILSWNKANKELSKIFYSEAKKKGKY